jgi:hypothetical protein
MAISLDLLAQTVMKKAWDACSEEELHNLTQRYPYFAPVHFLYLKKLEPEKDAYQKQYQKASLYYKDPVLFENFLNVDSHIVDFAATPVAVLDKPISVALVLENVSEEEFLADEEPDDTEAKITLPSLDAPIVENTITFEPFHTVDYFASQGIKLAVDEAAKDKFGKQVKSFTEWLKTMKRLPTSQMNNIKGTAEKQVENLAAHSVQSTDVVTEAMAEVWVHQGNKVKAREVYRKLSLLNPSKSAYFASKIELLNDSN